MMKHLMSHKTIYLRLAICFVIFLLLCISFDSIAADGPLLDRINNVFKPLQKTWYTAIKVYAERLFWILVLVDFGWTAVIYALEKNDIVEILVSFAKKIFTTGFFYSLLKFSDTWIPAIINSFIEIGTSVGNVSKALVSPDGIVATGMGVTSGAFALMSELGFFDSIGAVLPVVIMAILIFIAFLLVAVQLLVTLIESYIAIGAGVILLGFGGSRWTTDFATKYLQFAVGTGLKLMMLYLIVGTGQIIFSSLTLESENLILSLLSALGSSIVYAYLAMHVPQIASSMMAGSPSMAGGAMLATAITTAAATVAVATPIAKAAASGASSGGSALQKALGAGNISNGGSGGASGGGASGGGSGGAKGGSASGGAPSPGVPPPGSGDASNASLSSNGSDSQSPSDKKTVIPDKSTQSNQPSLSQRVKDLSGYVPQDMGGNPTINIDMKHTAD